MTIGIDHDTVFIPEAIYNLVMQNLMHHDFHFDQAIFIGLQLVELVFKNKGKVQIEHTYMDPINSQELTKKYITVSGQFVTFRNYQWFAQEARKYELTVKILINIALELFNHWCDNELIIDGMYPKVNITNS